MSALLRWTSGNSVIGSLVSMNHEPKPGQRLQAADFSNVVRLTPLIAFDMIVRAPDRRVLVGRRTNEPARGLLFVPGGRITKNETFAAAFRRISLAELGVEKTIEEARFLGVYQHLYDANTFEEPGYGTHYVTLGYEVTSPVPDASLPRDQHAEYLWKTEAEIVSSPEVHEHTKAYFIADSSIRVASVGR